MPNIWTTDDYVYQSTISGVNIYNNETEEMLWLVGYAGGVNSVWADDTYLYMGTTNSGVYRCSVSTISGVQDTHQYISEPDITNNLIHYIHGGDKYLCVSTASGVDHINMDTSARSYTDLDYGASKCFQTSTGRFYYLPNDYAPSGWSYRRKIKLSQPTIKNDTVYIELPYNEYDIIGTGPPSDAIGDRYDVYLDYDTGKAYRKDVIVAYGPNLFTNDAACSAAENSSNAHKALPPNTDSWGDWNTPDSSWYYDFGPGSGTAVCRVDLKPGSLTSTGYGYTPTEVAGSMDGINYDILTTQDTTPAKTLHSVEFENAIEYRYIRLRSTVTVNVLIMELYAYDATFTWQETQLPAGATVFPKGESLLHGGVVYPHYANNSAGDPNNMSDGDLETYCQNMTYLAVDFGAGNEKVVSFLKLCVLDQLASDRISTDNPTIEGSNDSTDGSDGTWDVLSTIDDQEWRSPNKYPGYGALFIPVSSNAYVTETNAGIATSGQGDASLVFDNTSSTYIIPGDHPTNWVQYEFPEPTTITRTRARSNSSYYCAGISYYGSNTGEFKGEEVLISVCRPSSGITSSYQYTYIREYTAQPYKFIRAIVWPNTAVNNRLADITYYSTTRVYNETPYRWYRLNGFATNLNLRLTQWELYEGDGLSTFDYSKTKSDGSDIRFRQIPDNQAEVYWQGGEPLDNLTEIPHVVDLWTTSGTSFIRTLPAEGTTEFYMYYGNPTANFAENAAAFSVNYNFESSDDFYAFNRAPEHGSNNIVLEGGTIRIKNDSDGWDCGIMANELMIDREAFMPNVSGTNPMFSFKTYSTQTVSARIGFYGDNNVFDRDNRDFELSLNKTASDPEVWGFLEVNDFQNSSGRLPEYPMDHYVWYDFNIELLSGGSVVSFKKSEDSTWTEVPFKYSWQNRYRRIYPGALNYYMNRLFYIDSISADLTYYDTSVLGNEEEYDPLIEGVKLISVYNNTSNWTEVTAGHVYVPGDGVLLPDVLLNDISVMEGASKYPNDNLIALASTGGIIIIEERQNDEENSRFRYYLLE